jgi:hypothetical protein
MIIIKKNIININLILLLLLILLLILCIIYRLSFIERFNELNELNKINEINEPKIAFLFLTYNNLKKPDIWNKFFDIVDNDINKSKYKNKFTIYNHSKEPEKVSDLLLKDKHIPEHIDTCWGCPNLVEANILMMKEALKDPLNKKFILVSNSCIPVVSFDKFYNEVMKDDNSRINIHNSNNDRYYSLKNPPFSISEFVKHSGSGIIINLKHAKLLVSDIDNFKNIWNVSNIADEHYIGTTLKLLDKDFDNTNNIIKNTFDIWSRNKLQLDNICNKNINKNDTICNNIYDYAVSPSTIKYISNEMINEIRDKKFLLIRKVDNTTEIDINYILQ